MHALKRELTEVFKKLSEPLCYGQKYHPVVPASLTWRKTLFVMMWGMASPRVRHTAGTQRKMIWKPLLPAQSSFSCASSMSEKSGLACARCQHAREGRQQGQVKAEDRLAWSQATRSSWPYLPSSCKCGRHFLLQHISMYFSSVVGFKSLFIFYVAAHNHSLRWFGKKHEQATSRSSIET